MPEQLIHYPRHNWGTVQTPGTVVVGINLRGQRESRGVRLRRLAARLGFLPQELSNWETGKRTAPVMSVARILGALDVDPDTTEYILNQALHADAPDFVDSRHQDHATLAWHYEHLATDTIEWAPTLIPDLLRTPQHERHLLDHPLTDPDHADVRSLAMPIRRDDLADQSRHYTFLLGDSALNACPPALLADQRALLKSQGARPNITVKIVPAAVCPPGMINPFTLYRQDQTTLIAAVHHHQASTYLAHRETLTRYHQAAAWLAKPVDVAEPLTGGDHAGCLDIVGPTPTSCAFTEASSHLA